jgi:hypothetical protein
MAEVTLNLSTQLLHLPENSILEILSRLDAKSLVNISLTGRYFSKKEPITRLGLTEHVARIRVIGHCGTKESAERFK